jgi:hypothetical protein
MLPRHDRVSLASTMLSEPWNPRGTAKLEPPDQASWLEVVDQLQTGAWLVRAVDREVLARTAPHLKLPEIGEQCRTLAEQIDEAAELLSLACGDNSDSSSMALSDVVGRRRTRFTLDELRTARDLGEFRDLIAGTARRSSAIATEAANGLDQKTCATEALDWSVEWQTSGQFTATSEGRLVAGWASDPSAVHAELHAWSTPREATVSWIDGPPDSSPPLCVLGPFWENYPELDWDQRQALFAADADRLAQVVAAIERLRRDWPAPAVAERIAARISELQKHEPQLPGLRQLQSSSTSPAHSVTAEWVQPRCIVSTVDQTWGDFDRAETARGPIWIPTAAAKMLAADTPAEFLAYHFAHRTPVELDRFAGPAGPLYELHTGGSHRTHLCRILGLPWMFASTHLVSMPRTVTTTDVTRGGTIKLCRDTLQLWRGLVDHGVVHGVVDGADWYGTLHLDYIPAQWLLLPADLSTALSRRYEQLYPGALARSGIPTDAIETAEAWKTWLTGSSQ